MNLLYILLAILIFGLLIFIHELGHFLVARWCGVQILEFSIGMGPKIFSKKSKKSGIMYSLRWLPLGGYVNMLGENGMEAVQGTSDPEGTLASQNTNEPFVLEVSEEEQPSNAPQSTPTEIDPELAKKAYCNQSVWKRILISLAGPVMNLLLGFILMLVLVLATGKGTAGTTEVGGFFLQYSAENAEAGFQKSDYLEYIAYDGDEKFFRVNSREQIYQMIEASETDVFDVKVWRVAEDGTTSLVLIENVSLSTDFVQNAFMQSLSSAGLQIGDVILKVNKTRVHTLAELSYEITNQGYKPITFTVKRNGETVVLENVQLPQYVDAASNTVFGDMDFKVMPEESFGFLTVLKHTWWRSVSTVKMVYDSLVGLFSGRYGVEAVSGPVGITKTITDVAKTGFLNLLYLVVVITINLGVMNLVPFPGLDGGHLLLYLVEIVRRKPVKKEVEGYINLIGLALILLLAVLITIKDVIAL